ERVRGGAAGDRGVGGPGGRGADCGADVFLYVRLRDGRTDFVDPGSRREPVGDWFGLRAVRRPADGGRRSVHRAGGAGILASVVDGPGVGGCGPVGADAVLVGLPAVGRAGGRRTPTGLECPAWAPTRSPRARVRPG